MRYFFLLLLIFTLTSCTNDDDHTCQVIDELNVRYDSQDNLVKINDGSWEQSWNLSTWEGLHPVIAVRHLWNTKQIRISSETYDNIIEVKVNGDDCAIEYIDGDWYCVYPEMHEFMDGSDVFYLQIKATKLIL